MVKSQAEMSFTNCQVVKKVCKKVNFLTAKRWRSKNSFWNNGSKSSRNEFNKLSRRKRSFKKYSGVRYFQFVWRITVGLGEGGELEFRPPGTKAQLKNKCTKNLLLLGDACQARTKAQYNYKKLIGLPSAPLLPNPLLHAVVLFVNLFFFCFVSIIPSHTNKF